MAKGDSIRTLSTAELLAEVHALDARRVGVSSGTGTTSQPSTSSTSTQPDAARALSTHFNDSYRDGFRYDTSYSRSSCGFRGHGHGHSFGQGLDRGNRDFRGRNSKK